MSVGIVLGVVLGLVVGLALVRRIASFPRPAKASALAWTAFGPGVAAVLVLASALFLPLALPGPVGSAVNSAQVSVTLSIAGVMDAVWALVRRDRHWVSWTALVVSALPILFWVLFALGHLWDPSA